MKGLGQPRIGSELRALPTTRMTTTAQLPTDSALPRTNFSPGSPIFSQGDPVRNVYVVVSGLLKLVCSAPGTGEVIAGLARPGDWLGETSAVLGTVYPFTARALTEATLSVTPSDQMLRLMRSDLQFSASLYESFSRQLQSQHMQMVLLRTLSGRLRLEWLLRTFLQVLRHGFMEGRAVPLRLSLREMADLTFLTQFHMESLLREFERRGVVRLHPGEVTILRPEVLLGSSADSPAADPIAGGFRLPDTPGNFHARLAMRLIEERHSDHNMQLRGLARELNVSVWHLARIFKRESGFGFREYVKRVRIRHATDYLLRRNLSIKEIAGAVGYLHTADFNHHFKIVHGVSPTEYRKCLGAGESIAIRPNG